jgi:hypothetical protein
VQVKDDKKVEITSQAAIGLATIAFWGLFFAGPLFAAMMLPVRVPLENPK